mmetsp:Transcript_12561/g.22803  ORF Transcript_12561/g.22803 Transcript_12561/m.22803 type:complete len:178 (-) Transcript_12561:282-815(-)
MRFGNPGTQESQIILASMTQFSQLLVYSSSKSEGVFPTGVGGLVRCAVKGIDNDYNINSKLCPQKTPSSAHLVPRENTDVHINAVHDLCIDTSIKGFKVYITGDLALYAALLGKSNFAGLCAHGVMQGRAGLALKTCYKVQSSGHVRSYVNQRASLISEPQEATRITTEFRLTNYSI